MVRSVGPSLRFLIIQRIQRQCCATFARLSILVEKIVIFPPD